jgi:glycosyltransferase involved in cell wall biosynthesis
VSGIHQFVPMLHRADAVGRHTLALRDALVARGVTSRIYVELTDPETASETSHYGDYADDADRGDVLVYQFATASDMAGWLATRPERLVVNSHNVTPPEFYAPWNNAMARHQLRAQQELGMLAAGAVLGLAVSAFNEAELAAVGYTRTAVVPPAGALAVQRPSSATRGMPGPAAPGARWICIGRTAPNKSLEDAVMGLLVARAHDDADATLLVVGRPVVPSYTAALHRFTDELGLHDAVTFAGALSDAELSAELVRADALVVTSRHEGFGVPVIEAMIAGIPVVANAVGALPEVVGDAGLLVDAADPYALADAVQRVRDDGIRQELARAASVRVAALDLASAGARAADVLLSL